MEQKLKFHQLVWIGTGHVIGAGVVSIVGSALEATGYSVWLAFAVACFLSFIRILPVIFFTSAVSVEGGRYGMITSCTGHRYGGLITMAGLLNWSRRGTAVIALREYISDIAPGADSRLLTVTVWTVFCRANLLGINMMSRIQTVATPLLLGALVLFSVVCASNIQPGYLDFAGTDMFRGGIGGFLTAVVLLSYSCDGIASLANYSTRCEKPLKNIPAAMITVSVITSAVYIATGFASGAVLPLEYTAGKTLAVTAKAVLSPALYNMFIFFGPVFALVTTMNAGIPDSALPVMAGVKDGWLPQWLAVQNSHGAYRVAIFIIYIIGCIPVVTGLSVASITGTTMVLGALSAVLLIISSVYFPFVFAEQWKKSRLHIPLPLYFLIITVCAALEMFVAIKALTGMTAAMMALNIILLILCTVYSIKTLRRYNPQSPKVPCTILYTQNDL